LKHLFTRTPSVGSGAKEAAQRVVGAVDGAELRDGFWYNGRRCGLAMLLELTWRDQDKPTGECGTNAICREADREACIMTQGRGKHIGVAV
jgi:hypothetical protein